VKLTLSIVHSFFKSELLVIALLEKLHSSSGVAISVASSILRVVIFFTADEELLPLKISHSLY
jgi:hypothetical protein